MNKVKILIVEDDNSVAGMVEEMLIKSGYEVSGRAVSGARAIILVEEHEPDLILMDIDIEGDMDGIETSGFIQEHFGVPVIFMTGQDDQGRFRQAIDTSPFGYVLKPFRKRELIITIEMALYKAKADADRRQAEKALRDSENKYRMLFMSASDAVVIVDIHTLQVLDANATAEEMYGYSQKEFLSLKVTDLSAEPEKTEQVFEDESTTWVPIRKHRKKDGTEFTVEVKANIFDYNNTRVHLSSIRDISERISAEAEKKRLEEQLVQSQKMEAIGQLAAGVAHEINNPIGFIASNLNSLKKYTEQINELLNRYKRLGEILGDTDSNDFSAELQQLMTGISDYKEEIEYDYLSDDIPELLSECREGSDHIGRIVNDLKSFAHPGEDKQVSVDINQGLRSTLNVVHNELKYKARVTTEFGDIPMVQGYPQKLNQVFMNILVNAAQAIEGQGEIDVSTFSKDGNVIITISDTGSGIDDENLSKIFNPFFTTKVIGKGTGLGMSISFNIIDEHQGNISVESTVGEGTTFTITLPKEPDSI